MTFGKEDKSIPVINLNLSFEVNNDPQQSFEVRHRDFNAKNSAYSFLFKMDKFKSLSKHKVFNDDGKEEKCRRGKFPLVYNEYKKRLTPLSAIRVIQERFTRRM